jgi:hypothetical protein
MTVFLLDEKFTSGVLQFLILGSLLLIYINDSQKITDNDAKVVFFAEDSSIILRTSKQGAVLTL